MRTIDEQPRPAVAIFEEVDKGHGRVEKRTVALCRDLAWLDTADRWPGLSYIVQVTRERTVLANDRTSTETAYYIGSDPRARADAAALTIRRHWSIENELHWVLDVAFREDEARHRARNTAQNMTTLRHFALNVIKRDAKRKVGVANSRKRAGWDRNYLLGLLLLCVIGRGGKKLDLFDPLRETAVDRSQPRPLAALVDPTSREVEHVCCVRSAQEGLASGQRRVRASV